MSREVRYVCHRAANAIITEVDPLRVSTDALQVINQFLDEFLNLLISSAQSLDLSRIKTTVLQLITSAVGKNAIVEAELQVKSYSELEDGIDYEAYERTRSLADPAASLGPIIDRLRHECVNYCNLAERNHQNPERSRRRPSLATTISSSTSSSGAAAAAAGKENLVISPIVTVYVTAVIEHVAEYILTAIARMAEHQDTEYIRVKEVYLTLSDDVQVGDMFSKMALRERLEKRASALNYRSRKQHQQYHQEQQHQQQNVLPSPAPSPVTSSRKQSNGHILEFSTDPYMDLEFVDDKELDYSQQPCSAPPNGKIPSMYPITQQPRPMSIMSSSTSTNTISSTTSSSSRKGFRLFKKRDSVATTESGPQSPVRQDHHHHHHHHHNSISLQQQQHPHRASKTPVSVSVYHSDSPAINFEDLIRSGDTVRLSLTPSRLKSIEIMKDHSTIEESASSSLLSTDSDSVIAAKQQQQQQLPLLAKQQPLPPSPSLQPVRPVSLDRTDQSFIQTPRHSNQFLHKKLSLDDPVTPFENPRSAPKPPILRSITPGSRTSFIEPNHPPRRIVPSSSATRKKEESMERPSSMVAKRASMISSARPTSFHENFALQYAEAASGTITTTTTSEGVTVAAAPGTPELQKSASTGAVREKVLKFELAEQQVVATTQTPKAVYVDAGVQTEPDLPRVVVTAEDDGSERGIVVGDEEWFVPDEDWEEDEHEQDHTIVEWLLGE